MMTTESAPPSGKTKVDKAQSYMGLASTSIGVIGAVGTAFVWMFTTFFTGDVTITPDKKIPTLMVKVVDAKGQMSTYYNRTLSLMPGKYHLEFGVPDTQPTSHADVDVKLFKTEQIPYVVPEEVAKKANQTAEATVDGGAASENDLLKGAPANGYNADGTPVADDSSTSNDEQKSKKHWWQIWKHSNK